jgi:hypothetical protein
MLTAGMRPAASRLAALVLLSLPAPALAADGVGVRSISVVAPERAQPLAVTLWSPARDGMTIPCAPNGTLSQFSENTSMAKDRSRGLAGTKK